ncbi:hypothetical protein QP580_11080, partial [Prevotella bivia]|uniref:hypothetical protein n=1 Tax=Prevotella bivia TaxID=28125 RepID=UPI00254DAB35
NGEPQAVHFWVFLGISRISKYEKAGAALIATPAHTCQSAQFYSSYEVAPQQSFTTLQIANQRYNM